MNMELLRQSHLFDGISDEDCEHLINCLNPTVASYSKNELVYPAEENVALIAIILYGSARVFLEDFFGNTNIVTVLDKGDIFDDIAIEKSEITIRALSQLQIMFIDYQRLLSICQSSCEYHIQALSNLIWLLADKNRKLNEELWVLRKRTMREKLLAYLHIYAKKAGSSKFSIPLNRAGLAEYLKVDRSALSRELCLMRDEGILEFYKSSFVLTSD